MFLGNKTSTKNALGISDYYVFSSPYKFVSRGCNPKKCIVISIWKKTYIINTIKPQTHLQWIQIGSGDFFTV